MSILLRSFTDTVFAGLQCEHISFRTVFLSAVNYMNTKDNLVCKIANSVFGKHCTPVGEWTGVELRDWTT
jgi:hypothetical protein